MAMLTAQIAPVVPRVPARHRLEPILGGMGFFMILSLALTLPALWLDGRILDAEGVWLKPVKFQIALAIHLLTLAYFARFVPRAVMAQRRMRLFLMAVAVAVLAEMIWIGGAAMYAIPSHYNTHPVMYGLYLLMGAFAVLLTTASLVFGLAIWRDRDSVLPSALRLAVALGLILTFALTVPAAGVIAALPGPLIGMPTTGAHVPVMGWSREVGDLRIAHFLATHALHAVPLLGLAAHWALGVRLAVPAVWVGAALYAGLTVLASVQALMGQPFVLL